MIRDGASRREDFDSTLPARPPEGWPGLSHSFHERATQLMRSASGKRFTKTLARELIRARGRISPLGIPVVVNHADGAKLRQFADAYHRCMGTVVRGWVDHEGVRRVVTLPRHLRPLVASGQRRSGGRIDLCRLDLLPDVGGGFHVVETNANCPGGLLSSGHAARSWRSYLGSAGLPPPPPLEHEEPGWMARWFVHAAEAETGESPQFVPLLRWDGGNRLELPALAGELRELGVDTVEADPRELRGSPEELSLGGRAVRHAYWKLGIRELSNAIAEIPVLVAALKGRTLFVQNDLMGRLIGDNKLSLAVMSDPAFESLFEREDIRLVRAHLPWSRNAARCSRHQVEAILSAPRDYVLKRPFDTRGRGVVIGREVRPVAWRKAVDRAVAECWLVQSFCAATQLAPEGIGSEPHTQDLSVGLVEGRLVGAMSRSSPGLRTNVAIGGRLHPVFMGKTQLT